MVRLRLVFFWYNITILLFSGYASAAGGGGRSVNPNYKEALAKSLLFFQGQRSGRLPPNQQLTWRSHSALSDGRLANVDLTGGYYDAGDNVKFNLPMAFTTTMLSWSTLEYGKRMGTQLPASRAAIRWATDYLLKCATSTPGRLYVGVGDPNADHRCWERPEDMDTVRSVYYVSPSRPGSDVAGETAAALASASMVFRSTDAKYAALLLRTARKVLQFGLQFRGAYSDALGASVCPFYCSYSGYKDELLWGAAWLFRATNEIQYYNIIKSVGANDEPDLFSWDNKYSGAHVLLSRISYNYKKLINLGGLMYKLPQNNLQYVTSITFLLTTYAKYIKATKINYTFKCGNQVVNPNHLLSLAKRQASSLTIKLLFYSFFFSF
ncbi:Endoglucanase 9 [Linum perenne]